MGCDVDQPPCLHVSRSEVPDGMLVLIGGNGFLGRHTTIEAHRRGIDVAVVAPRPDPAFLATHAPSARSLSLDVFDGSVGEDLLKRSRAIVYLAGRTVPASNTEDPATELKESVAPAFNLFLRVSRINPRSKLVMLSSGGTVYGRVRAERVKEDHPLRPISPYGLGKVMTEQALAFCAAWRGQRYAVLRASNPVGRWHSNERQGLVPAVLRSIRSGAPLTIYGDGSTLRDYIDADDLADAILRVALDGDRFDDTWNVGSGRGISVMEVIETVATVAGRQPTMEFRPRRSVDVDRIVLDCSKIREDFGWQPVTSLRASVEKIILADDERKGAALR
jgi:UDP-glucose 4-epimerase